MKLHMQVLIALGLGFKRNWHIFFGLVAGVIVGALLHSHSNPFVMNILTFVGQLFIRLIQMVVIPLVISAIVIGITSVGDNKQLGKFGKKMVLYYGIITVAAVSIGAFLALGFKPGLGAAHYINNDVAVGIQSQVSTTIDAQKGHIVNLFLSFIPKNPLESIAKGDMVPIIVFALVFSIALAKVGDVNRSIVSFFESVFAATMKLTDWIMFFAAPGVFALTAVSVSTFGIDIFSSISKYLLVLAIGFGLQLFVVSSIPKSILKSSYINAICCYS